ncbi:MAG TPA: class I SAM-dependent methyltransferase [Xanthomonadaceae bacterium]|nr:class I SAM-dependent methyltransferase [Xanthomonadaceae bacterium]
MQFSDTARGKDDVLGATSRFSNRVHDYVRHRPDYPPALMAWLRETLAVDARWRVADVGAGTGISTRMWLDAGHDVVGVEPNEAMRLAAQAAFAGHPRIAWSDGTAERTGLADASVDLASAAQAFHWFDPEPTRAEWARILRPGGLAVVYWNTRLATGNAFLEGYERLLRDFGTDYARVAERHPDDAAMRRWFGDGLRGQARFAHGQRLDFEGLRGRLLSSSYAPIPGHPRHDAMLAALRGLFDAHAVEGHVELDYATRVFAGNLS